MYTKGEAPAGTSPKQAIACTGTALAMLSRQDTSPVGRPENLRFLPTGAMRRVLFG
ncbi:MAG: hypothetical protein JNM22_08620 [Saprospiraceae bacterium]|nr:hypothetical protein [Saprospiraceae bacterium]